MQLSTLLILGGTFDPVHNGHLIIARAAAEAVGAPGVLLLPCAQSPHKQGLTHLTTSHHRLSMLEIAIRGDPFFAISTLELLRPPPSYSFDTVQKLRQEGWSEVGWLVGGDQAANLPNWHRAAELSRQVKWVVAGRHGNSLQNESLRGWDLIEVETPLVQISSTDIRRRVAAGKSIRNLVPEAVERYIAEHGLYRDVTGD
jgi:nicotinate-nucleotide adenylyltransferase